MRPKKSLTSRPRATLEALMPHGLRIGGKGQGCQLTVMCGMAADGRFESVHMTERKWVAAIMIENSEGTVFG
jgi:hypothetical protein